MDESRHERPVPIPNLYAAVPELTRGERIEELLRRANVRIERITSAPGSTAGPFRQRQDEWVTLLQGRASLEMGEELIQLASGDCLYIPADTPHRVLATSIDPPCLWLAIHIYPAHELADAGDGLHTEGG